MSPSELVSAARSTSFSSLMLLEAMGYFQEDSRTSKGAMMASALLDVLSYTSSCKANLPIGRWTSRILQSDRPGSSRGHSAHRPSMRQELAMRAALTAPMSTQIACSKAFAVLVDSFPSLNFESWSHSSQAVKLVHRPRPSMMVLAPSSACSKNKNHILDLQAYRHTHT